MSDSKTRVLITGAAGRVAGHLRAGWGDRYALRLADVRPVEDLAAHEEWVELDITDLDAFTAACEGMDVVVHLAADPSMQADFYESLLERNIKGGYNGFEAARRAGCRRVVFASSINAVLGYQGRHSVRWDEPVFPQNVYGATKVFGEALARVYANEHGLSCLCVRLGAAAWTPDPEKEDLDRPHMGITARDQAELFGRCVDAENVSFAIVPGVSRHRRQWLDVEDAVRTVDYQPQDGTVFMGGHDG